MEDQNKIREESKSYALPVSIVVSAALIAGAWAYSGGFRPDQNKLNKNAADLADIIAPKKAFALPVNWGDLGIKLARSEVVDAEKFESLLRSRGGFDANAEKMLYGSDNGEIVIDLVNANTLLNFFWALGLGNKNEILEQGPMARYGDPGRFASTGGWTLAQGGVMDHYAAHRFFELTPDQQKLAEETSQNIYRPCCDNPTHFPDCNHGMAMLGLLELMASQGVSKEEMYRTALKVNAFWFPDQYSDIAKFLNAKGIDWNETSPEKILAQELSGASGYRWVSEQIIRPEENNKGGGCAV